MKIIEVTKGVEDSEKHVDTKLAVLVNTNRLVIHAYNSTQNVMIQGKYHKDFALSCLEPYFAKMIDQSLDKIAKINNEVKETLGKKKDGRTKNDKPHNCPQCLVTSTTIGDLKKHMKICHTKPGLNSPGRKKAKKLVDDMDLDNTTPKGIEMTANIEVRNIFQPDVEDLLQCDYCDFDFTIKKELDMHKETIHGCIIKPSTPTNDLRFKSITNIVENEDVCDRRMTL